MTGTATKDMHDVELNEFADANPKLESRVRLEDEKYRQCERQVVRKLDLTLLPMLWILYVFNYLDRNNIAYVLFRCKI